jgi:hypothetical protein
MPLSRDRSAEILLGAKVVHFNAPHRSAALQFMETARDISGFMPGRLRAVSPGVKR